MEKFYFRNKEIIISDEREAYNEIVLEYGDYAYEAEEDFIASYKQSNKSLDDVIKNSWEDGLTIIYEYIDITIEKIIKHKIYNIDRARFIEQYSSTALKIWYDAFSEVYEEYVDIVATEQEKEVYRQYRKEARGKFQGGGFGLKGAVKGAVQAGAINIATGLAHDTFNIFSRAYSNLQADKQKQSIFNNPKTIDILSNGIYDAVFSIHHSYILFLSEELDVLFDIVNNDDEKEAEVILSNISNINIPEQEKIEIIAELILLSPYNTDIYDYAIYNFGDESKEIEEIASYFGYDTEEYKMSLLEDEVNKLNISNEEEIKEAKEIALEKIKKLGMDNYDEACEEFDSMLEEYDLMARTVKDIVFDTREEATLAKQQVLQIDEIVDSYHLDLEENVDEIIDSYHLDLEENVIKVKNMIIESKFIPQIADIYIDKLDKILTNYDLLLRTVKNIVYDTREEAILAKNDLLEISKIKENIDPTNEENLLDVKEKLSRFNTNLEEVENLIKLVDDYLNTINTKKRTLNGIVFESAEEYDLAKQEKDAIYKILKNFNIDNIIDCDNTKNTYMSIKESVYYKNILIKAKEDLIAQNFKSELSIYYINLLEEKLEYIEANIAKKAEAYSSIKSETCSCFGCLTTIIIVLFFFWVKINMFWKIIFILMILFGIPMLKESLKNLKESKKAFKITKNNRK